MTGITLGANAWKDIEPTTEALVDNWLVAEGDTEVGRAMGRERV